MKTQALLFLILCLLSASGLLKAQVNSGSNGSDGAFHPTQNVTIDMNLRPDGIYHYTSVNIPAGVNVTFTPNANNTPVVWLVQGDCVIGGSVALRGSSSNGRAGAVGGPGGFQGGRGSLGPETPAGFGFGPGAGEGEGGGNPPSNAPGNASFGSIGDRGIGSPHSVTLQATPGRAYGSIFLVPLIGGSGGGGGAYGGGGGGGGGGSFLIACSSHVILAGGALISVDGGEGTVASGNSFTGGGGGGSGGAVRIVTNRFSGSGAIRAAGGQGMLGYSSWFRTNFAGKGRIRIDAIEDSFSGANDGITTRGFQPIILPAAGQGTQLAIQSIGGLAVAASPNGVLANPEVVIPAQQQNPMSVVIGCSNLPLNTLITVVVRPTSGPEIVATGRNTNGSATSSTATIPVEMPRGGGVIFARCVSGVNGVSSTRKGSDAKNIAQTGWTADGETFSQIEITAGLDGSQKVAYLTASGKRYALPQK